MEKKDYFNFRIVNFRFMCINIAGEPVYVIYVSRSVIYSRHDIAEFFFLIWR